MSRTGSTPRYRGRAGARTGSSAKYRARHHRRRRYPLAVLLGLAVVIGAVTVLATGLIGETPTRMQESAPNTAADYQRSRERDAEPSPSASPSPVPVLKRSVEKKVTKGGGTLVPVGGKSEVAGKGPLKRYVVQVEKGLPGEPADFAAAVEKILGDQRSWGGDGEMSFQRVADPDDAQIRVSLAAPKTLDSLCAPLSTNGYVSCTQGRHVIINQNRWVSGVPHFDGDLDTYRIYVINHEVGHALGHGHVNCSDKGEPAPVMQQQTFGLQGCEKNGWVHP